MPRRAGRIAIMAAVAATALTLAACGGSGGSNGAIKHFNASMYTTTPGGTPQPGGTLVVATASTSKSLDPALLNAANQESTIMPIYDQLVRIMPGFQEPQPDIATSWKVSPDGLTYDFTLRPGMTFSNGQPVTAKDVVFTYMRMARLVKAGKTNSSFQADTFTSVTAVGEHEVKLVLKAVHAALLDELAEPALSIVPASVVTAMGENAFGQKPIGSGPFMVKSFAAGKSLELVRNPHYWEAGKPYLDGITFNFVPEVTQRILAVRSGEADVADAVSATQAPSLKAVPNTRLLVEPFNNSDVLNWNVRTPPFGDQKVRLALNLAIPRAAIIKDVYRGYAVESNSIIPKVKYWDPTVPVYPYDLAKAKQLLSESSAPHGFSTTIYITGGDPQVALLASIIQSSWAQLGVKAAIREKDFGTFLSDALAGKEPLFFFSSGGFTSPEDPDQSATLAYDYERGNHSLATNFQNTEEEQLVRAARASTDEALRKEDFQKLQRLSYQLAQMMPIAYTPSITFVSATLHGYQTLRVGWPLYQFAWLASNGGK
jgi:peptide/nickel transport system substrate-binding protein